MNYFHHQITSKRKGKAAKQSAYINGRGTSKSEDEIIYSGHGNLPGFAEDNPSKLWLAADKFERKNGSACRQHEIGIPNVLPRADVVSLAIQLAKAHAGEKPFEVVVHCPVGKLSNDQHNHVHTLICDRFPDGYTRDERLFFSRHNAKHPGDGGAKKDGGGMTSMQLRDRVLATKKLTADVINAFLEKRGISERVDYRSLKEQGVARAPEKYLGQQRVREMSTEERIDWVRQRALRRSQAT